MRKYIVVIMALLTFLSCRDDQTEQPETGILIEQKEFNVNPQGEIIRVKIKNTKTKPECKISENATDWIQLYSWGGVDVANTSEYTFIYKVLANDGYEAIRSGSIHIKSGSYSDVVNIHQSGGVPVLYTDENTIIVDSKGGEISHIINSNFDYSIEILDADWIKVVNKQSTRGVAAYTLTLCIDPNTSFEGREGKIRIYDTNGTSSEILIIRQKQQDMIELDKTVVSVDDAESSFEISVHANVEYQVKIDEEWISQSQMIKESETTKKYIFKVNSLRDASSRQGSITFSSLNSSENVLSEVVVNQNSTLYFTSYTESMVETEERQLQFINNTDQSVIWSSSNSSVASVDNNGNVKALREGITIVSISSSDNKHVSECKLLVTPCLSFVSNPEWVICGEQVKFEVENKMNLSVSWSSSNPSVASVDNYGVVSALTAGKTKISVISEDGNYTISSELTVKHITDVVSISRTGVGISVDSSGSYFTSTYTIVNGSPNEIILISLGDVSLNNQKVSGNSSYEVTLRNSVVYPSASLVLLFKHNGVQYSVTSK